MKCIKNEHTEEIRRVGDGQAQTYVELGDWNYIPKEEWKAARKADAEKKVAAEKKAATKKDATKSVDNSKGGMTHRSRRRKNRTQSQERISNG